MPACPSAPCFSPKATGSVPLLRDLLSAADVTRLHTLRPAPPVPGLYAALALKGFFPWEELKTLRHIGRAVPCPAMPCPPSPERRRRRPLRPCRICLRARWKGCAWAMCCFPCPGPMP